MKKIKKGRRRRQRWRRQEDYKNIFELKSKYMFKYIKNIKNIDLLFA